MPKRDINIAKDAIKRILQSVTRNPQLTLKFGLINSVSCSRKQALAFGKGFHTLLHTDDRWPAYAEGLTR